MGPLDAGSLLAYFFAIRTTGVAVATFFLFMQPVWVALLAPRLLKTPTERVVYLSLGVALGGLGVIVVPSLLGERRHVLGRRRRRRSRRRRAATPSSSCWSRA